MKIVNIIKYFLPVLVCVAFNTSLVLGQDKSTGTDKAEATIGLAYSKKSDQSKVAIATVKTRNEKGKFAPAAGVHVNFYSNFGEGGHILKNGVSDGKGQVSVLLPNDLSLNDSMAFSVSAKIENDPKYQDAEDKIQFAEADITIVLNPNDTTNTITAKVTSTLKDGRVVPLKDVAVKFYVQRLFGDLAPMEDNSVNTDANGEAVFNFPKYIPGDTAGAYNVVAKIEDNDRYGNIEKRSPTNWGVKLKTENDPFPRALWEPYAPIPLVITVSVLFGGVWMVYGYLFIQMFKIKKASKKMAPNV